MRQKIVLAGIASDQHLESAFCAVANANRCSGIFAGVAGIDQALEFLFRHGLEARQQAFKLEFCGLQFRFAPLEFGQHVLAAFGSGVESVRVARRIQGRFERNRDFTLAVQVGQRHARGSTRHVPRVGQQ